MNRLTDLQLMMHADGALSAEESRAVEQRLSESAEDAARFRELVQERGHIVSALGVEAHRELVMPKFRRALGLREFAIANIVTGLVVWLSQFVWKALFGELLVSAASWFSIPTPDFVGYLVDMGLVFVEEGNAMETYFAFIAMIVIGGAITWFAFFHQRRPSRLSLVALPLALAAMVAPPSADALEVMRGEATITIDADETIDDSVMIAAETIIVDGDVKGNLAAFGRRVVVSGDVGGNLIVACETFTLLGNVEGALLAATQNTDLSGAEVGWDLWTMAELVNIDDDSRVNGNVAALAEYVTVDGAIGRDLVSVSETVEVRGTVGRDLEAIVYRAKILGDAMIGGDIHFRGEHELLEMSPRASVGGDVYHLDMPEGFEPHNRFLSGEHYLWQLFRLLSGFVAGLALLWLMPGLREVVLAGGVDALKTAGIGIIALVSAPIIVLLLSVTLVGLPIGLMGLLAWLVVIYLAKIVVAHYLGQAMLSSTKYSDSLPLTLLAGLLAIIIAVNLPLVGGVISFICLILGIGLIVQTMLTHVRGLDRAAE